MPSSEVRDAILKLSSESKSIRNIATEVGMSKSVVASVLSKSKKEIPVETAIPSNILIDEGEATSFLNGVNNSMERPEPSKAEIKAKATTENLIKSILQPEPSKAVKPRAEPRQKIKVIDDPEMKASIITKITIHATTFEPLLLDVLKPSKEAFLAALPKKAVYELECLLKLIEQTRATANAANMLKTMFFTGAVGVEMATQRFLKMKTQGFAAVLQSHSEIEMIMKEIAMERASDFQKIQRPEIRLASIVAMTLLSVDSTNRVREISQQKGQPDTEPEVVEQISKNYSDL